MPVLRTQILFFYYNNIEYDNSIKCICHKRLTTKISSYAAKSVKVTINTFNVEIKASDGLSLSLNGKTWSTELNLGATTKDILANVLNGNSTEIDDDSAPELAYVGNENYWLGVDTAAFAALSNPTDQDVTDLISELVPLSTYGELNSNSKLIFYSKSSMTASSGGYNLRADLLARKLIDEESGEASDIPEEKGYIAFDLFVKNKVTGGVYGGAFNLNNDEAVYLTTGSKVGLTAASSASKGLENSLRIAFMEIGRMSQTAEASDVIGMMCDSTGDGITVLCNKVNDPESANPNAPTAKTDVDASRGITYNIWEPNDTIHTPQSVKKFKTQCRNRGTDGAYTTTQCTEFGTVAAGADYVPTYVVYQPIGVDDKVDIYDGHNDYTDTIGVSGKPLKQVDYYTDTECEYCFTSNYKLMIEKFKCITLTTVQSYFIRTVLKIKHF